MRIIFSHGWGGHACFFSHFASCHTLHLEHIKNKEALKGEEFIGVGHSLGFQKLLESGLQFKKLFGIQAFCAFLGRSDALRKKRVRSLNVMKASFQQNPQKTLQRFYETCGLSHTTQHLQKNLWQELLDLEKKVPLLDVPTHIIATEKDPIVPPELIQDNFAGRASITMLANIPGHNLGQHNTEILREQIPCL